MSLSDRGEAVLRGRRARDIADSIDIFTMTFTTASVGSGSGTVPAGSHHGAALSTAVRKAQTSEGLALIDLLGMDATFHKSSSGVMFNIVSILGV